jgi:hypothetical protein
MNDEGKWTGLIEVEPVAVGTVLYMVPHRPENIYVAGNKIDVETSYKVGFGAITTEMQIVGILYEKENPDNMREMIVIIDHKKWHLTPWDSRTDPRLWVFFRVATHTWVFRKLASQF